MDLWISAITAIGIYALAVASPGPNFLVITRNALAHSRHVGVRTALGVASGSILWITFGFLGVAAVFSEVPSLFTVVKGAGACYFFFTAIRMLRPPRGKSDKHSATESIVKQRPTSRQAFRHGLLTQMSNPKAAIFVLALFSSAISPATPYELKLAMALIMILISFSWYLMVSVIFSQQGFQSVFGRFQRGANLVFSGLLLWLAVGMVLSL
jgi:RhtB (resistance to homoserine/threonine) family protein